MPLVIDASVTAVWCLNDEQSDLSELTLRRILVESAMAPTLWWYEIRNILLVNERRGRVTEADIAEFTNHLKRLPISLDGDQDNDVLLALARTHRLTAYDAAYLETAQRHGAMLATLDKALATAAKRQGVKLLAA